jgi:RNA polymerase sigma factor (sigma-70 family)
MLLRFCRAQAGPNHGDDVFQETMLAALRAYDTVRDPAAVKSWLWSIAARKAVDAPRAEARTALPVPDPEPQAVESEPVEPHIWDDVALLPLRQRQAVFLRFMADLSHREIARVLQMNEDAARRNVFEGLRRLRRGLAPALASDQRTKEHP